MKALSIKQPWAWLIANGFKDIENRSWETSFRGEFLIHAGASVDRGAYPWIREIIPENIVSEIPTIEMLSKGGIVGIAEIVDCVNKSDSPWFVGPWGFVIKNARPLNFKKYSGQLKFFNVQQTFKKGGQMAEVEGITERREIMKVPVKLTAKELKDVAEAMCQKLDEIDSLEMELSGIKKSFKERIDAAAGEVSTNRKIYVKKIKEVEKEVIIRIDWNEGTKLIIDPETGELLKSSEIPEDEQQRELPLENTKEDAQGSDQNNRPAEDDQTVEPSEESSQDAPEASSNGISDAADGADFFEIGEIPDAEIEVRNGDAFVAVALAGLKEGDIFRIIKQGQAVEINKTKQFVAIGDPERDAGGNLKIKVV